MAPQTVPARLHVVLARESKRALVIRRGPSRVACTIGWDRSDDSFATGQWLRARLFERRCDLSPDGKHFIYFAANNRRHTPTKGSWTAISRTPYLKAIALWAKGDSWNGGGLFLSDREFWLNENTQSYFERHAVLLRPSDGLSAVKRQPQSDRYGNECLGVYFVRLQRDGWTMTDASELRRWHHIQNFEKRISNHWTLCKHAHARIPEDKDRIGRGVYYDEHALKHARTGVLVPMPRWEWAEVDGNRLVWAEGGGLYAGRVGKDGLGNVKLLKDFNAMTFEPLIAPY